MSPVCVPMNAPIYPAARLNAYRTNRHTGARIRPFSSKRTSAVEGAVPSLIARRLGVDRVNVAQFIFGPRKHVGNESPHDLGGLIGAPGMDRDLDRDYVAVRWMAHHVRHWRSRLMLSQGNLLLWPGGALARR
jgi:hypothetical protein